MSGYLRLMILSSVKVADIESKDIVIKIVNNC